MTRENEINDRLGLQAQIIDMVLNTQNISKLQVLETFIESYLKLKGRKINENDRLRVCLMDMLNKVKSGKSLNRLNCYIQHYWLNEGSGV